MTPSLTLEKNLALFAGAGAGKTHGLVTLCLHVLAGARSREPVPASRLCLVTFTEKAAAEMRQRLTQRVEALARGGANEPELAASFEALGRPMPDTKFWRGVLEALPGASISTFHALCLALLRRTPGALDPGAALLEPDEATELLRDSVERVVLEALEKREAPVEGLCRLLPFGGGLVDSLVDVLTRTREEGIAPSELKRSDPGEVRHAFDEQLSRVRAALAEAMSLDAKGVFAEGHQACLRAFEGLSFESVFSRRLEVEAAATLVRKEAKKGAAPLKAANGELWKGTLGYDKDKVQGLIEIRAAFEAAEHERTFVELLERARARYADALARRQAIDFSLMLTRARDLLRDRLEVRREVQARCGVLLVDEFQDTNRLQLELVLMLAEREEGGPRAIVDGDFEALPLEPAKLCIVGDRKQSIYDFRGADVALFERLAAKIVREGGEEAALKRSWRSTPELVGAFNDLFAQVLVAPGDARPYEIRYRPEIDDLAPVRGPCGAAPVEAWAFGDPDAKGEDRKTDDAEAVARGIRLLLASGAQVEERNGTRRPLAGGDIAILLRGFGPVEFYRQALLRHRIPHRIVRGRGFFGAQEVLDLASLLALIGDPGDGLAAAAVLRSPFVALSDSALVALGLAVPGLSLERIARAVPDTLPADDAARLRVFLSLFEGWRAARGRVPLRTLLELALEQSGYRTALAATALGEQALANVEKLVARAERWDLTRPGDLEGFATELRRVFERSPDEAQADAFDVADPRAVQLLTVHQSKGLEWPVVVLPNLSAPPPPEGEPVLFDRTLGLAIRPRVPDAASLSHSPRSAQLAQEGQRRRKAESLRVLYVAMTRARDRLVLTGLGGKANSWAGILEGWLEAASEDVVRRSVLDEVPLPPIEEVAPTPSESAVAKAALERVRHRAPARVNTVVLPVTQLQDFALCPRRFHFLHELGLVERPQLFDLSEPGDAATAGELEDPRDQGRLAHRLLEQIDFAAAVRDPGRAVDALLAREGVTDESASRAVREWVTRFLGGEFAARLARLAPARIRREVPFMLKVGEGPSLLLKGQIDLLVEEEDGSATVVDYKAARRHPKGEQGYAFQLACYALAARAWSPHAREVRTGLVYLKDEGEGALRLFPPAELAQFESRLAGLGQMLAGSPTNGPWEGRPRPTCEELRCGFRMRCHPTRPAL